MCNSIKKAHLENFRKLIDIISKELNWSDTHEIVKDEEPKTEVKVNNDSENVINNDSESMTNDLGEKQICKLFKAGKYHFGGSGKNTDQQGKIYCYIHPTVYKKHEKFGKYMDHRCKKLHLIVCRSYLNTLNCKYGKKCKFFHPHVCSA